MQTAKFNDQSSSSAVRRLDLDLSGRVVKRGSSVSLTDGRSLKVHRVSKTGVLTLVHACGGFAAYSHVSAVVA